jgi:hypothetical protein
MAGAALPFTLLSAQQGGAPPRPASRDTIRLEATSESKADTGKAKAALDSAARAAAERDSIEKFKAGDTVRTPFAHAEDPRSTDIGAPYQWDRDQLMTSGAQTLADLLDRIPGASGFRTAWLVDQQSASYLGDFNRVRVFVDGLPWAPPDRDGHGVIDLTAIQLWAYEHCTVERGGTELRVYLRSWRYDKTIPSSRVDVFTGDQDANTFRGFYAQRFGPGLGIQAAGENLSLSNSRTGGDGSRRAGMVRLGWARGKWSVDITHQFVDNNRNSQARVLPFANLPAVDAAASLGYARVAWGDPDQGTWVQAMAATSAFASLSSALNASTSDSNRVFDRRNAIYQVQAGTEWSGLRLSGGMRWSSVQNVSYASPLVRASYDRGWVTMSAYAERALDQGTTRGDVSLRLLPRRWLAIAGSYGGIGTGSDSGQHVRGYGWRGELGLQVRQDLWLTGGMLARDSSFLQPATRFDSTFTSSFTPKAQGTFAGLRGRLYSDIFTDIVAISWDQAGLNRPRYQTRAEVFLQTRWLSRFPSGVFGLLASVTHEYREPIAFAIGNAIGASTFSRTVNAKLEVRIMSGVVSYRILNLAGDIYTQIPGALMPRSVSVYGIRWEFRN